MKDRGGRFTPMVLLVVGLVFVFGTWGGWACYTYGKFVGVRVEGGTPAKYGQFGDTFGAINALFTGLAFLGAAVAIWQQRIVMGRDLSDRHFTARLNAILASLQVADVTLRIYPETSERFKDMILKEVLVHKSKIDIMMFEAEEFSRTDKRHRESVMNATRRYLRTRLYMTIIELDKCKGPILDRVLIEKAIADASDSILTARYSGALPESYNESLNSLTEMLAYKGAGSTGFVDLNDMVRLDLLRVYMAKVNLEMYRPGDLFTWPG